MTDAVIVSTARTGARQELAGRLQHDPRRDAGRPRRRARGRARRHRRRRGRGRDDGLREARRRDRQQHRAPDRAARRLPGHRAGHDGQPLLLVRPADDRDGGAAHHRRRRRRHRRRRRRVDLLRAERDEQAHASRDAGSPSTSPRSTGRCCRPPRRSPSATTSRASARTSTASQSQQRAAAAAAAGRFKDEIVPITVTMGVADKETARISTKEVTIAADEGIRADTTYEGVAKIKPAMPGGVIAAGNASQFSDGAGACVVMSDTAAASRGPEAARPLPRLRGRRLRARRDGHRPGVRRAEAARAHWPDGRPTSTCGS